MATQNSTIVLSLQEMVTKFVYRYDILRLKSEVIQWQTDGQEMWSFVMTERPNKQLIIDVMDSTQMRWQLELALLGQPISGILAPQSLSLPLLPPDRACTLGKQ